MFENNLNHLPIGHYGNGFKSGSMRLARDAIVFTASKKSASVGFLSQTYLEALKADCVFVPMIEYRLPHYILYWRLWCEIFFWGCGGDCKVLWRFHLKILKKIENCTMLIPKGNSYCHRKSSARGPRFKVSSEGLSAEIDIPLQSPIQVQTKADVA